MMIDPSILQALMQQPGQTGAPPGGQQPMQPPGGLPAAPPPGMGGGLPGMGMGGAGAAPAPDPASMEQERQRQQMIADADKERRRQALLGAMLSKQGSQPVDHASPGTTGAVGAGIGGITSALGNYMMFSGAK